MDRGWWRWKGVAKSREVPDLGSPYTLGYEVEKMEKWSAQKVFYKSPGFFFHKSGGFSRKLVNEWKESNIGDTPIFHWTMIVGGRVYVEIFII